ncbi:MAG: hypothetical protein ABW171_05130 [Steroidobacter sp.]
MTANSSELVAFENGTLDPARFDHRLHLSLAWTYLQRDGFPEGALHFRRHLKSYVAKVGAENKYHETITWAYMVMLNEELSLRSPPGESFEAMIQRRPDLLDHRSGAIARRYSKSQLDLSDARRVFLLPVQGERAAS